MKKRICLLAASAAVLGTLPHTAEASSHREAPFITEMPKVDNTDFYMFRSYETNRAEFTTIIANFQPLQSSYGGPNFFTMDSDALYEIHIDNTGDGGEDITFQFQFKNALNDATGNSGLTLAVGPTGMTKDVSVPLINIGGVDVAGAARNVNETFIAKIVRNGRRSADVGDLTRRDLAMPGGTDAKVFAKPLDNVGGKTFANYALYASNYIFSVDIPGCTAPAGKSARLFVGQRQEGFAVLLGNIFDLVNATTTQLTDQTGNIANPIGDKNITSIALEIPTECLVSAGGPVIGGWSTASVRQARVVNPTPRFTLPSREGGPWAQVSRLGSPLVNEVVIGVKDKDKFNASEPKNDGANFADYITNPTLPALLEVLFGPTVRAPTLFPRADILQGFATGAPGATQIPAGTNAAAAVAEMLRLNTSVAPTTAAAQINRIAGVRAQLGAAPCFVATTGDMNPVKTFNPTMAGAACDPAGFPNGRRPGDDVVDIALRVMVGALVNDPAKAPTGTLTLGDLVPQRADQFDETFPYLKTPNPGGPAVAH